MAIGVNESIVSLDIITLTDAVFMRPTLIRLQLALSHRQPMHRREIQSMPTAKFLKIEYGDLITTRIKEAFPNLRESVSRRTSDRIDVESDFPICTLALINPFLLNAQ